MWEPVIFVRFWKWTLIFSNSCALMSAFAAEILVLKFSKWCSQFFESPAYVSQRQFGWHYQFKSGSNLKMNPIKAEHQSPSSWHVCNKSYVLNDVFERDCRGYWTINCNKYPNQRPVIETSVSETCAPFTDRGAEGWLHASLHWSLYVSQKQSKLQVLNNTGD